MDLFLGTIVDADFFASCLGHEIHTEGIDTVDYSSK